MGLGLLRLTDERCAEKSERADFGLTAPSSSVPNETASARKCELLPNRRINNEDQQLVFPNGPLGGDAADRLPGNDVPGHSGVTEALWCKCEHWTARGREAPKQENAHCAEYNKPDRAEEGR